MSSSRPPVLWSKLRAPTPVVSTVDRPRLIERIVGDVPSSATPPIWVLTAPSGYGKTTLARQVIEHLDRPTVWLTVDARDDDAHRFWSHLSAGLSEHGVDTTTLDSSLADGHIDRAVDDVHAAIEQHSIPITLVFDDVHELSSGEVLDGIGQLVEAHPGDAKIGLLSRRELDFIAFRLRTRGLVTNLNAQDLAFNTDEALLALHEDIDAGRLDEVTADAIIKRLDGWPAGLRLTQLAIAGDDDSASVLATMGGAHPDLAGYLAGEVLDGLDAETRDFIVATSVLEDMTPGACDAVTDRSTSLTTLRSLTADHVFTTLIDPVSSTFRYHGIFREFAASRLAERPAEERKELHLRALRWCESAEDNDGVIRHAVAAGRIEIALERLLEAYIPTSNAGQIETLWRWVKTIGAEAVLAHPVLGPLPAWASLNQQRYDEIEPWLESIDLVDGLSDDHRVSFEMQAAAVRSHRDRHLGRIADAVAHGCKAAKAADGNPDALAVATAQASLGVALSLAGDARAQSTLTSAISSAQVHGEASSVVTAFAHLGLTTDDDAQAEHWSDQAIDRVDSAELERFHRPAAAWLVRAGVRRRAGRVREANAALDRGIELAQAGNEPATLALLQAERARIAHVLGERIECRAALREADSIVDTLTGATHVSELVRAAHNDTRFAPRLADDQLPVGARELTERELVVLRMLPHGLSRRDLARELFVSENTLKTHLTSIRRKLGASGRDDLVQRARLIGILSDIG